MHLHLLVYLRQKRCKLIGRRWEATVLFLFLPAFRRKYDMLVDLRSLIRRKLFDRSRKGVQRAWFDEKIVAVVTLGRSTCPAHRENRCSGHSRASNVPGSAREPFER